MCINQYDLALSKSHRFNVTATDLMCDYCFEGEVAASS